MAESPFSRCSHFQYCLALQAEGPAEWIFLNSELAESPVGLYKELASTQSTYTANVNAVFWGSLPQSRLRCGHVFCAHIHRISIAHRSLRAKWSKGTAALAALSLGR